jgi:hypothetical protein
MHARNHKDVVSNQKFDTYMLGLHFTRRKVDHYCVYFKLIVDQFIYLVLYVDDMLVIGNKGDYTWCEKIDVL